jgi:tyrosine-protein kinase Etk/Wzc
MEDNSNKQTNAGEDIQEISILDLIVILVQQRWFIAKIAAAFAVIAIIYAIVATPVYKSTVEIMPPASKSGSGIMSGMGDLLGTAGIGGTTGDTVVGVTKSNIVLDKIIDKFDLLNRKPDGFSPLWYIKSLISARRGKPQYREDVRKKLSEVITSEADKKSNIITITVKDTSPDLAVKMAQDVFDETQSVLQIVGITPTAQQRIFLEGQVKDATKELQKAQANLTAYQSKTGLMDTDNGATSPTQTAIAELQARMVAKGIELNSARRFATADNPRIKRLEAEYAATKKQFEENKSDTGTSPFSGVGIKNLPSAAAQYAALMREYKFREALLQSILKQYEAARISEAQDPMVIQLLSPPTVPELKDSPKRKQIVILATLLGIFLGIFAAFIRHFLSMSKEDPEVAPKINFIKASLSSDMNRIHKKR